MILNFNTLIKKLQLTLEKDCTNNICCLDKLLSSDVKLTSTHRGEKYTYRNKIVSLSDNLALIYVNNDQSKHDVIAIGDFMLDNDPPFYNIEIPYTYDYLYDNYLVDINFSGLEKYELGLILQI